MKRSVSNSEFTAKCETAILESVCLFFDYKFPSNPWKCFLKEFSFKMIPLHMKFNFMNHHPAPWQKSRYSKTAVLVNKESNMKWNLLTFLVRSGTWSLRQRNSLQPTWHITLRASALAGLEDEMPFSVKLKVGHVFSISESSITSYSCFWKWKMATALYWSGLWITEKQLMLSSVAQEDARHFMRRKCSTVMWRLQSPQNLVMPSLFFLNREENE